jgi:hypothetical protein
MEEVHFKKGDKSDIKIDVERKREKRDRVDRK